MFINRRKIINYNLELKKLARKNRKYHTEPENKIWQEVLCNKKTGYKFLRQKPIDIFILDFYCSKLLLAIEVDGDSHYAKKQKQYDKLRSEKLNFMGIKVLRYKNNDVMDNIEGVFEDIKEKIKILEKKKCLN